MKKLFTNYKFSFTKNEKKILSTFCRQTLKQIEGDNKYFAEVKAFSSILEKLNTDEDEVKLTKDERTRLVYAVRQNVDFIQKEIKKVWFLKKWLYKSMLVQYQNLLENQFKD